MTAPVSQWDFNRKTKAISIDVLSAVCAACAVAPGIAIIDQAVTEKAANKDIKMFSAAFRNLKSLFL